MTHTHPHILTHCNDWSTPTCRSEMRVALSAATLEFPKAMAIVSRCWEPLHVPSTVIDKGCAIEPPTEIEIPHENIIMARWHCLKGKARGKMDDVLDVLKRTWKVRHPQKLLRDDTSRKLSSTLLSFYIGYWSSLWRSVLLYYICWR